MAQSVKLSDGSYVDASAVYDTNAGRTQQEVNSSKLDKAGGTITGDVTVEGAIFSKAINGTTSTHFILLPKVPFGLIDPTHTKKVYLKEWIKWICANYPSEDAAMFIGKVNPDTDGLAFMHIYHTAKVDSNGYPQYASGMMIALGGALIAFGFQNYTYYYKLATMTDA